MNWFSELKFRAIWRIAQLWRITIAIRYFGRGWRGSWPDYRCEQWLRSTGFYQWMGGDDARG